MLPGSLLGLIASLIFLAIVAGFLATSRALARHHRRLARDRTTTLIEQWRAYARGASGAREVRAQARAIDAAGFWSTLEILSPELPRSAWRRLSDAVARASHVRDERYALRDDSPWRRVLAARRLGLIHAFDSRRALRHALRHGPEPVAYAAVLALARQRDAAAWRWIFTHPSYFAKRPPRARTALFRAFGPAATPRLAAQLVEGIGDPGLERAAIERLGAAGHAPSVPAILRRLESGEVELRVAAARALGRLEAGEAVPALTRALGDSAWEVRAQAARALGRIGDADVVSALASLLTDEQWWVRRHAAYALAELGIEGQAALSLEARVSRDRYARDMASEALAMRAVGGATAWPQPDVRRRSSSGA